MAMSSPEDRERKRRAHLRLIWLAVSGEVLIIVVVLVVLALGGPNLGCLIVLGAIASGLFVGRLVLRLRDTNHAEPLANRVPNE
jgi:hypothetical protein